MPRIALAGFLLLGAISTVMPHDVITTSITWNREISRIFFDRCAACHNEKGMAFSMLTYAEARPWADAAERALESFNERMAALYRQHVLKEAAPEPVIQIKGLGGAKKKEPVQEVLHKDQQ